MALIHGLRDSGHEIDEYGDNSGSPDGLVVLNHQSVVRRMQARADISPRRTVLIALEPMVTAPQMYRPRVLRLYGHVFAASPLWAQRLQGNAFLWPQEFSQLPPSSENTRYAATLINANKRSAVDGSLYGLRRSTIAAFDNHSIPLAVVGPGWNDPLLRRVEQVSKAVAKAAFAHQVPSIEEALSDLRIRPRYQLGTVRSKSDALALARCSIVIENSSDYVSEKLIDAICAGVAPLYVGPPLLSFQLPENLAIACESNVESLFSTFRRLSNAQIADTIQAGQEWLNSPLSSLHEIRRVLYQLGRRVGRRLRTS